MTCLQGTALSHSTRDRTRGLNRENCYSSDVSAVNQRCRLELPIRAIRDAVDVGIGFLGIRVWVRLQVCVAAGSDSVQLLAARAINIVAGGTGKEEVDPRLTEQLIFDVVIRYVLVIVSGTD